MLKRSHFGYIGLNVTYFKKLVSPVSFYLLMWLLETFKVHTSFTLCSPGESWFEALTGSIGVENFLPSSHSGVYLLLNGREGARGGGSDSAGEGEALSGGAGSQAHAPAERRRFPDNLADEEEQVNNLLVSLC